MSFLWGSEQNGGRSVLLEQVRLVCFEHRAVFGCLLQGAFTEKGVVDGVGQPLGSIADGEAMECQQC